MGNVVNAPVPGAASGLPTFEVMMTSESKPLVPGIRRRDSPSDTTGNYQSSSDAGSSPGDCENQSSHQSAEQAQPSTSAQADTEKTSQLRRSEWWNSAMVITGEVMGTGVLSLPHALASLGWTVGLSMSIIVGFVAIQMGIFLSRIQQQWYPQVTSYATLAQATVGPNFRRFTAALIYLNWSLLLPYYLIACADALLVALPSLGLSRTGWIGTSALLLLPPLQLRSLHGISFLSTASTAAVLVAIALLFVGLLGADAAAAAASPPPARARQLGGEIGEIGLGLRQLLAYAGSVSAFFFAYLGQSIFLEIMREMREPAHFPKALVSANLLMMVTYTATAALGYGALGDDVPSFLPDAMPAGFGRVLIGLLIAFHTAVCYLIVAQPLHAAIVQVSGLFSAGSPPPQRGGGGVLRRLGRSECGWFALTSLTLVLNVGIASAVPFFASVQNLIGSCTGAPIMLAWPSFFYLRASALNGVTPPRWERLLCYSMLCVATPFFSVLGTADALAEVIANLRAGA